MQNNILNSGLVWQTLARRLGHCCTNRLRILWHNPVPWLPKTRNFRGSAAPDTPIRPDLGWRLPRRLTEKIIKNILHMEVILQIVEIS